MNRRAIISAALFLPIGYVVSGMSSCGVSVSQLASDANTIANGITAVLPTIQTITGLSTEAAAQVTKAITAIQAGAASLAGAAASGASAAAQAVAGGVSAISSALSSYSVPSWVSTVLSAAETLVPLVLEAAGVALAANPAAPSSGMTPAQARAILTAAAAS